MLGRNVPLRFPTSGKSQGKRGKWIYQTGSKNTEPMPFDLLVTYFPYFYNFHGLKFAQLPHISHFFSIALGCHFLAEEISLQNRSSKKKKTNQKYLPSKSLKPTSLLNLLFSLFRIPACNKLC